MMTAGMLEMTGYDSEQTSHFCYGDIPTHFFTQVAWENDAQPGEDHVVYFSNNL